MKSIFKYFLFLLLAVSLTSCAEDPDIDKCVPVKELFRADSTSNSYELIGIPSGITGQKKGIVTWVTEKISQVMRLSAEKIFLVLTENNSYKRLIGIAMTISIMFYALGIMLGIAQANGYQAMVFAMKLIIIYQLATDWGIFYHYVGESFEALVNSMMSYASNTFSEHTYDATGASNSSLFGDMDKMISMLWNFGIIKLNLALLTTGPTGFFWGLMVLILMFLYLFAVITIIKTFLLALIGRFVLYALAPLFLIFALFSQTKSLFDNWLHQLIGFALQPVLLFIFIGMFQMILGGMLQQIYLTNIAQGSSGGTSTNANDVCVKSVAIDTAKTNSVKMYKMVKCKWNDDAVTAGVAAGTSVEKECVPTTEVVESDIKPNIPLDIWVIISCIIITYLMYTMVNWVVGVASSLAGGVISVSDAAVPGFDKVKSAAKQGIGSMGSKLFETPKQNRPVK
ncbi:MAG TPA: hypothetical protein DIV86_05300 [Alphaproteobacteria bacterium]|nr:hypothetical protein [Alphaproteobacteria bacterium]